MKQVVAQSVTTRGGRKPRPEKRNASVDLTGVMTVEEAALAANVSVATIWRWRNQGVIRGQRVLGRTVFDRSEVEAALQKRTAD